MMLRLIWILRILLSLLCHHKNLVETGFRQLKYTGSKTYISEAPIDLGGQKVLFFCVDDYRTNVSENVSIVMRIYFRIEIYWREYHCVLVSSLLYMMMVVIILGKVGNILDLLLLISCILGFLMNMVLMYVRDIVITLLVWNLISCMKTNLF